MKQNRFWAWVVFLLGASYFIVPLVATFEFSLRMRRGYYSFDSYASVFSDPNFQATFGYSVLIGIFSILVGIVIVVPAVYFVRLRLPWLRPFRHRRRRHLPRLGHPRPRCAGQERDQSGYFQRSAVHPAQARREHNRQPGQQGPVGPRQLGI